MTLRTLIGIAALALSGLSLTACINEKALMLALVPHDDDVLARHFIELVRVGDYENARLYLDASLKDENIDKGLRDVHDLLAKGEVLEIEVIGCNVTSTSTKRRSDLSYQLHFHDYWAAGDVVLDTQDGSTSVVGFHFNQIPNSFEVLNRFSLQGKSAFHYVVLACCIGSSLLIIYSLVICIRTRIRRKWLWIIFILFGLMQLNFNWTTAAWEFKPAAIVLFGASCYAAGPYAPWVLSFGFPVGALIFLVYRKNLLKPSVLKTQSIPGTDG